MSYIRYEIDPKDPKKTELNRLKAYGTTFIGFIMFFASLFCIAYLISSLIKMFEKSYYFDFIVASVWMLVMVVLDSLPFVFSSTNKKSLFGKVFLCLPLIASIITLIIGIAQLCNNDFGIFTVLLSILLLISFILISFLRFRKANNMHTNFSNKNNVDIDENCGELEIESNMLNNTVVYCHKCGKSIPPDSSFCPFCGVAIPKSTTNS